MAVLMRSQLLAARSCSGSCPEANTLPKTRFVSGLLQSPCTLAEHTELKPLPPAPAGYAVETTDVKHAEHVKDEMHTPRDAKRGRQNGVDSGCVETPEKPRFPKSRQLDARDTFSHEKIWKIPALNLNADANEFIPGSFASLLPAILPSVPTVPTHTCLPSPVPPGLEMCGLNGLGPTWDDMTTQFGMDSAWEQSTLSTHLSSFPTSEASPKDLVDDGEESQNENRMLKLASCLLRFLMQAPVLETSDLMKIIETQLGEAEDSGPWCQRDLKTVSFTYKDLALLDARLAALLHKLSPELLARLPRQLNLDWDPAGMSWSFKEPPELRRLIAKNENPTLGQFSITFLSHASGCVPMHLDRMLKFKRAGIACLQGLDSSTPDLASGIIGKGYGQCCGKGPSGANTIMWDRSYWTFCESHECDAGLAVDLISADQAIRIACWRPRLEHSFDGSSEAFGHFLLSENVNLVVCADLSLVGGTSSAGLVPALLGLQSAMFEILGHEVLTPKLPVLGDSDDFHALWDPCGIFFRGVEPTTALSGYTEGYLSKMSEGKDSDLSSNFPDGKPVLFAEFGLAGLSRDPDLKK